MAIIARWRCPPDSSCGYARARRSAWSIPTRSSRSTAASSASLRPRPRWTCRGSATWRPIRITGFRAAIGSWKIIDIELPRCSIRRLSEAGNSRSPARRISPVARRSSGSRPITARAVMVLPDPDSPISPVRLPAASAKEAPSTRRSGPVVTVRSSTSSNGPALAVMSGSLPGADQVHRANRRPAG